MDSCWRSKLRQVSGLPSNLMSHLCSCRISQRLPRAMWIIVKENTYPLLPKLPWKNQTIKLNSGTKVINCMYVNLESFLRFSFEYRNTKTKVITTANQKTHENVLQRNNENSWEPRENKIKRGKYRDKVFTTANQKRRQYVLQRANRNSK